MKRSYLIFLLLLAGAQVCIAQDMVPDTAIAGVTADKLKFSWNADMLGFGRNWDFVTQQGSLNPDNYVAQLDRNDGALFLRPAAELSYKKISLFVQPRLNFEYDHYNRRIDDDIYFQKLMVRYQLNNNITLKAGRYFRQMGNGLFINPSNTFSRDPQRINPKLEPRPKDYAELTYSTKNDWRITAIANLFRGEDAMYQSPYFTFYRRYGLQVEKYGNSSQGGILLSSDENGAAAFGLYGQKNIGDAFVVWIDMAVEHKIERFYPQEGHPTNLVNYNMVSGAENNHTFFSGLAGASYTLQGGATFYAEYYYNGRGYDDAQWNRYYDMVSTAGNYTIDITRQLSKLNLGRALNNGNLYNRHHYLFTQFVKNDIFDKVNIAARYFCGIDDYSHQVSALIEYNVLDNLEVFSTNLFNIGAKDTEFNRLLNHQVSLGLIYHL